MAVLSVAGSPRRTPPWASLLATALAAFVALPAVVVLGSLFVSTDGVWAHLVDTVLVDYVVNSLVLVIGVAIGTLLLGVVPAWLVTMYQFRGNRIFAWALLLPLASPAYIIAYTYTGLLDFAGPVQMGLRDWFGWQYGEYWFPNIRSHGGAICMLSLVLYPYVFLLARTAFTEQSVCALEVSRTLGCSPIQSFFRVGFPLARPAVIAGLALALMETLADYGTVQYFGIPTFTTGIFRTWFGLGEPIVAAQLASLLLIAVSLLLVLERRSRRRARYHHTSSRYRALPSVHLSGRRAVIAVLVCATPVVFGFIVPAVQLLVWSVRTAPEMLDVDFFVLIRNSLGLAFSAAMLTIIVALVLAYSQRLYAGSTIRLANRVVGLGYAIPGTIIAIGVMVPLAWIDNQVDAWFRANLDLATGLLLSGTLFALFFAYLSRFGAVALGAIEAGLGKIGNQLDQVGRSVGVSGFALMRRVHVPMLRGTLTAAFLLVFVDVLKELPATLILRPFNFNTLAVRTYELANEERLFDAAPSALAIVLVGIIPVVLLSRIVAYSRPGHANGA